MEGQKENDQVGGGGEEVAGVVQFFGREVTHHVLRRFGGVVAMFVGFKFVILPIESAGLIQLKFVV